MGSPSTRLLLFQREVHFGLLLLTLKLLSQKLDKYQSLCFKTAAVIHLNAKHGNDTYRERWECESGSSRMIHTLDEAETEMKVGAVNRVTETNERS